MVCVDFWILEIRNLFLPSLARLPYFFPTPGATHCVMFFPRVGISFRINLAINYIAL